MTALEAKATRNRVATRLREYGLHAGEALAAADELMTAFTITDPDPDDEGEDTYIRTEGWVHRLTAWVASLGRGE